MALVECSECKATISDMAAACVKCGAPRALAASAPDYGPRPLPPPPEESKPVWPWILAAIVGAFFFVGFSSSNSPEGQAKAQARSAISMCWEEQGRKSLSPGAAQFAAGACERMQTEFRQKYGVSP